LILFFVIGADLLIALNNPRTAGIGMFWKADSREAFKHVSPLLWASLSDLSGGFRLTGPFVTCASPEARSLTAGLYIHCRTRQVFPFDQIFSCPLPCPEARSLAAVGFIVLVGCNFFFLVPSHLLKRIHSLLWASSLSSVRFSRLTKHFVLS
jgi:hypothetical protein